MKLQLCCKGEGLHAVIVAIHVLNKSAITSVHEAAELNEQGGTTNGRPLVCSGVIRELLDVVLCSLGVR